MDRITRLFARVQANSPSRAMLLSSNMSLRVLQVGILLAPKNAALVSDRSPPLLEGGSGHPVLALPRRAQALHLRVQFVDLLQGQTLGLVDEEVDESDADEAAGKPDEEHLRLQVGIALSVVDEVRRHERDRPVEEPL